MWINSNAIAGEYNETGRSQWNKESIVRGQHLEFTVKLYQLIDPTVILNETIMIFGGT